MKTQILASLLLAISIAPRATASHGIVGYTCDKQNDQLLLTYETEWAYSEDDDAEPATKRENQWEPSTLVTTHEELLWGERTVRFIGSQTTINRICYLSSGEYHITIYPIPGNFYVERRCGGFITAGATVKKDREVIYQGSFESHCHDTETSVTTRIVIKASEPEPEITTVAWDDH